MAVEQQQAATARLPLVAAALQLLAQPALAAPLPFLGAGHPHGRHRPGVAAQIAVQLVAQRRGIELVGLLFAAIAQRLGHDHVSVGAGGAELVMQPVAARSGFIAGVHLAATRDQSAHQDEQLRCGHRLRTQGARIVDLHRHGQIPRVDVAPQLDLFRLGFEQTPE